MRNKKTRFREGEFTKSWKAILKRLAKRDNWLVVKKHRVTLDICRDPNTDELCEYVIEEWVPTPFLGWLLGTLAGIVINVLIGLITSHLQQ